MLTAMDSAEERPSVLVVKNTFISSVPTLLDLKRAETSPPTCSAQADSQCTDDGEEDDSEDFESADDGEEAGKDGVRAASAAEPAPLELCRAVTYDAYEDAVEWSWAARAAMAADARAPQGVPRSLSMCREKTYDPWEEPTPANPESVAGAVQPVFAAPAPVPVSLVLVPVEAAMAAQFAPAPGVPAGFVPVPISRFDQQPACAGMPAPPMQAPVVPADAASQPSGPPPPCAPGEAQVPPAASSTAPPVEVTVPPPRALALERAFSAASNIHRVRWTVSADKLSSKDREWVSPSFELGLGGAPLMFKMMLHPKVVSDSRGGASFRRAKGKGRVELFCADEVKNPTIVNFRFAVGSSASNQECPRGPVRHDFFEKPFCGLPSGTDEWDFKRAVDASSQSFVVCLEILGGG